MIGRRLGHYEITSRLGTGGMGEVYRARDERLGRDVAIKVLAPEFVEESDRRARLEREAKTVSALNHPNICTLYDLGREDGLDYLVMEYLEGETLAEQLEAGPLPIDRVLSLGAEVASALDAAHRQGIVHRDLKPGNVMVTRTGAKLLDFGLAKQGQSRLGNDSPMTQLPTEERPLTEEGTILGTFRYMAPEQLEGTEADPRTDIFALGVLLHEMATGKQAFEGKSRASLIAAIMEHRPAPISQLAPLAPAALDHVVERCLEKEAENRWQSARDVASELQWIAEAGSRAGVDAPVKMRRKTRERLAWQVAAGALLVTAILSARTIFVASSDPSESPVLRFSASLDAALGRDYGTLDVSPDGIGFVVAARSGPERYLFHRARDRFAASLIPGTEGALQPAISPDGQWVAFAARQQLWKVALAGGAPMPLAPLTSQPRGIHWADDDTILFVPFYYGSVYRVPAAGGQPERLTELDREAGERNHRWPRMLPGSEAFLYTIGLGGSFDTALIVGQRLDGGQRRVLVEGGSDGRYLPTGHLAYRRGTEIYAIRFDPEKLVTQGEPVRILGEVADNGAGAAEYAFSDDGLLAYLPAGVARDEARWPSIVDRSGSRQALPGQANQRMGDPVVSPEGKRIAATIDNEIWVFDLARGTATRLSSGARAFDATWSHDGLRIVYSSERAGPWNPYWRAADGSDQGEILHASEDPLQPDDSSPDGRRLLLQQNTEATDGDVLVLSLETGELEPFVQTTAAEGHAVFSPDGHWVAYDSDESGRSEVYVRRSDGGPGRWQISTDGGQRPQWKTPDEITYLSKGGIFGVRVSTGTDLSPGVPERLLEGPFHRYAAFPDGERFVVLETRGEAAAPNELRIVVSWFEEVRELLAAEGEL